MKNCIALFFVFFLFQNSIVQAFDIKAMFSSMGTTFGAPPVGYTYSFEVWSDANVPIYVEQEGYASFMGATFPGARGFYGKNTLPSIFDGNGTYPKATYHSSKYYFQMYIGDKNPAHESVIYKELLTQLPLIQKDPKIYYYHAYTLGGNSKGNSTHTSQVEMLGYQDPTQLSDPNSTTKGSVAFSSQLSSLAFYNSSGTDTQVSLTYGTDSYTFTLEKYSYNSLELPTPDTTDQSSSQSSSGTVSVSGSNENTDSSPAPLFSLRPNTLTFSSYDAPTKKYITFKTLKLPATGFDGTSYTIEIFQDPGKQLDVCIQGFNPGNYDLGVTSRIRDLTPCPCTFWYQSFEQGGSIQGYADLPGQVWVVYGGLDSPVQMKIEAGQAFTWNLVRPLVNQGDQFVYFIYVVTTDDAVAAKFVEKVASKTLGINIIGEYQKAIDTPVVVTPVNQGLDVTGDVAAQAAPTLTPAQEVAAVMGNLNIASGVIEDTDQGVIGYIVGTDVFTSKGLGFGRYYYVLAPSIISMSSVVSSIQGYLDSSKTSAIGSSSTDIQTALTTTVNGWFTGYMKKPADVQTQVQQYLIQYGNSQIVDTTGAALTKYGQTCLQSILSGSISLKYPSMKLSTVTNQFVYDFGKAAPSKMPTPISQKPISATNASSN